MYFPLDYIISVFGVFATVLTSVFSIYAALRSSIATRAAIKELGGETISSDEIAKIEKSTNSSHFESLALSKYYNHALTRANVSFWFSLVFASIGFSVIIFAFATHSSADVWGTVVKAASGTVIDAVSALFFVQSTSAQKSMGEFFEKLRLDRLNAEARDLLASIENAERRDELKTQLVLKYANIERLLVGNIQ